MSSKWVHLEVQIANLHANLILILLYFLHFQLQLIKNCNLTETFHFILILIIQGKLGILHALIKQFQMFAKCSSPPS